ncbi:MAG: hypothetical protein KF833_07150 [Verrucomicrobiae bacterium]|nr:hypothetical protein [Verrucomicrobiae bacterium]
MPAPNLKRVTYVAEHHKEEINAIMTTLIMEPTTLGRRVIPAVPTNNKGCIAAERSGASNYTLG